MKTELNSLFLELKKIEKKMDEKILYTENVSANSVYNKKKAPKKSSIKKKKNEKDGKDGGKKRSGMGVRFNV